MTGSRRPGLGSMVLAVALALAPAATGHAVTLDPDGGAPRKIVRLDDTTTRYNLQEHGDYLYRMPSKWDWIAKPIPDIGLYFRETFQARNSLKILGVAAATLVLMRFDQDLVDAAQRLGNAVGIPPLQDNTRTVFSEGRAQFRIPADLGSALYFLGDGWTHLSTGAVFLAVGLLHHDNREVQTGSQVFEAVLSSGTVTQVLKHLTGHQDPDRATAKGGKWRFFPDQKKYFKDVSSYDAFPSGHLATAMATVTVIAGNYPEKGYVWPVGGTLMTLLGLQMMNNGVHWASDYPVALALGWGLGRIAVRQGREAAPPADPGAPAPEESLRSRLSPTVLAGDGGELLVGVRYEFRR